MRVFAISFAIVAASLLSVFANAETSNDVPETPSVPSTSEMQFVFNKSSKQPLGTLKATDKKEGVFFEFEGKGLSKGAYAIVKVQSCDKKSFKAIAEGSELMNFETTYGDISSENTVAQQTLASLDLDKATGKNKVALIKKEKKKSTLLFCGE